MADETPTPREAPANTGSFDIMGGTSVALLGYNVVRIQCKSETGGATLPLPTGFRPMSILPPLVGTCELGSDGKSVVIASATMGATYFIIGQN